MSPFEPLSPNFNTLYCEAIDWLKMSTPNMHWFQLFRRGQKCNLWIPLSRTYTMRFWGRLFALKMVVLIHKVGMNIFIGPESDHWLCLSVTNWLPNWLTDSCLVVPLAMFKRLLWLQSRITWLLRVLGKYYFADLHRIHVRLQCIYCAVKSFLSFEKVV